MTKQNRVLGRLLAGGVATAIAGNAPAASEENTPASQTHYPISEHQFFTGPDEYFTGKVEVEMLFPPNETAAYSGAYVTFEAGARTAWHSHPAGQHMIVMTGTARTGTRDGKVLEFGPGEALWCPSDVDHWHGATPDAEMKHLVLTGVKDGENVVWKEKVSDTDYRTPVTPVHHSY